MTARALLLVALAVAVGGCSDTFVPTVDDGRVFAIDGTLDGRVGTQRLRVQDLAAPIGSEGDRQPARVTSTELASGVQTVWRDSLITLSDGTQDRLYLAPVAIRPGDVHRVVATRADGAESSVVVRLPNPRAAVTSEGGAPAFPIRFAIADLAGEAIAPVVRYRIRRDDGTGERDLLAATTLDRLDTSASILAILGTAEAQARTVLYGLQPGNVVLLDIRLEMTLRSPTPEPVVDGVGGVGWAVPISLDLPVAPSTVAMAGFVDARD